MSLSDSQTQKGKRSRETSEVFDAVFSFLMDFATKAETVVPEPKRRAIVDDDAPDGVDVDDEEPLEKGGDGNAGELFDKLPIRDKEELLKDVFGEIVGIMLDKLPEDGKEAFLVRCFDELLPKLPGESQRVIEIKVKDVASQSQEDFATSSAQELPLAIPNLFPRDELVQAAYGQRIKVRTPDNVANPRPPRPGPGPQQPRPGPTNRRR